MNQYDLMAAQDEQRTQRNFISLIGGLIGNDQSTANQDGYAVNQPGQFRVMAPYGVGGVGVEGQPMSTAQGGVVITLPMLLLIGGAAYLLLKN